MSVVSYCIYFFSADVNVYGCGKSRISERTEVAGRVVCHNIVCNHC